jgi:predicted transcriptional regulator
MSQVLGSQSRLAARRSAFEVVMDVLKAAADGATKPTHIMYRSNTSWIVLKKHLDSLSTWGFIMKKGEGSGIEFTITEKGRAALQDYTDLVTRAADLHGMEVRL